MQCPDPNEGKCCNGLETNCDMQVNEIMFASVHNANHAVTLFPNHKKDFEGALHAGYRSLNFDLCSCDGILVFCHAYCGVGKREVKEVFTYINKFLNENPTEVVVINIEISVEDPTPLEMWNSIKSIDGITEKTYVHQSATWPTMESMVDDGHQLIFFQHSGPDCSNDNECTSEILTLFDYTMETEYSFKTISEIEDVNNSCTRDRGRVNGADFYAINNFVTETFGPSDKAAETLNSMNFLTKRIKACEEETGLEPNFVNIDFWEIGDLPEFVQTQNKARAVKRRSLKSRFLKWFGL